MIKSEKGKMELTKQQERKMVIKNKQTNSKNKIQSIFSFEQRFLEKNKINGISLNPTVKKFDVIYQQIQCYLKFGNVIQSLL